MAKIDFYCPACGETTKQYLDYFAPGPCDFVCNNCLTVWLVKIEYKENPPNNSADSPIVPFEEAFDRYLDALNDDSFFSPVGG